ncbi:MAG: hypothetical protein KA285_00890 [Bacteroidia bacterium]|nr:hypothetical protein [Bacteroidia bacterium]
MTSGSFTVRKIDISYQEYIREDHERRVEMWCGDNKSEIFYDPYKESVLQKMDAKAKELQ